jgi:hypothetical protein
VPADATALLERVAFWLGVGLPCLHVPLLLVAGFDQATAPVLLALWTTHAVALFAGAQYDP